MYILQDISVYDANAVQHFMTSIPLPAILHTMLDSVL